MSFPRYSAKDCARLMTEEGYVYLDVRTVVEFDMGHPEGAYNVPVMASRLDGLGLRPNPDFVKVVKAHFSPDTKLIVGCRSGQRSQHAALLLLNSGYETVADNRAGFAGNGVDPGWRASGGSVALDSDDGRSYTSLSEKLKG